MAKLSGFQCDRCGVTYSKNTVKDHLNRCDQNMIGMGLVNTDHQLFRYDLCDECLQELQAWISDSTTYVADTNGDCVLDKDPR